MRYGAFLSKLQYLLEFTKAILRAARVPAQTRQKKAQITNMAYDTTKKIEALKSSVFIVTTKTCSADAESATLAVILAKSLVEEKSRLAEQNYLGLYNVISITI